VSSKKVILPPGIGEDINEPLLYNPYQSEFMAARRQRFCLSCSKVWSMSGNTVRTDGTPFCPHCQANHATNISSPRLFDHFLLLSGRGGGKTLIGAHAGREEMLVPKSMGWVMGPTFKILHDSTFPTLIRRIPPSWVKHWSEEHMELTLVNDAKVAFRSLEDPERARGPHGIGWGWFDEAAQSPERAFDVFKPTLIKAGGIVICTTTVFGYDWTYEKIEKKAVANEKGYWFCKYWTEENPLFQANPVMRAQIERDKATMPAAFYAQEYRAERINATGSIYGTLLPPVFLDTDDAVRKFIPEWPNINPDRQILIGLDSGADHPFGAIMIVVTDRGLVAVDEYLERGQAHSVHYSNIFAKFRLFRFQPMNIKWSANKNEKQLRLEFAMLHVGVVQAENKHAVGIQRTQSWLVTKQLVFAPTVLKTRSQMQAYRYADNYGLDGQKKKVEDVFKLNDELPDCIRYALMAFPSLPDPVQAKMTDAEADRWNRLSVDSRNDIARVKAFNQQNTDGELKPADENYPVGSFFGNNETYY
jgi:phage terminase large subunit